MARTLTTLLCGIALLLPAAAARSADAPPAAGDKQPKEPEPRQGIPVVNVQHWYTGTSLLTDPAQPDLRLEAHTLAASAGYGHHFARTDTTLVVEGRYFATFVAAAAAGAPERHEVHHSPLINLVAIQGLSKRWGLMAFAMVGVGSDMVDVTLRDVRLYTGGAVTFQVTPQLSLAAGAMCSTMIDLVPLPLITVDYRRGPLRLQLLVPDSASAWLSPRRWIDVGLMLSILELRYGLHATDRFADLYYGMNLMVGPAVRLFLHEGLFIRVDGGYNARFYTVQRNAATVYATDLYEGYFISSSVGYLI